MISIVIPTRNDSCLQLVSDLALQAAQIDGLTWEIVVADDATTDENVLRENLRINDIPHCRLLRKEKNVGRAAIRNFLAKQARGEWLLFIDGDGRVIDKEYLRHFVEICGKTSVCYGGYRMAKGPEGSLRWIYEQHAANSRQIKKRKKQPYQSFNIANLLIRKDIMLAHPLDERFRRYGYEDVLLGKSLQASDIAITHIDAPIGFVDDEDNASFMAKTEEGLQTLWLFRHELQGYSTLLDMALRLNMLSKMFIILLFQLMGERWRAKLISTSPSVRLFQLYKLGYLLTLAPDAAGQKDELSNGPA